MNILFLHKDFPAQFEYLASTLGNNPENNVFFITNDDKLKLKGVNKLVYKLTKSVPKDCHPYLRNHEELLLHGQEAATLTLDLRKKNINFDVIYSHPSGPGIFMKYIYPNVPLIYYCDWFNSSEGADLRFAESQLTDAQKMQIRVSNSIKLMDLYSCDACVTSTQWQKDQFPESFQDKIQAIHYGIDTEKFKPNSNTKFVIENKNIELSINDEVITYGTRGMEPYRGFPQFIEIVAHLQKRRPNLQVVITGEDKTYYSPQLANGTYKTFMLQNLDLDMNRVHFVGKLPKDNYVKLLQISSAHVYFTYPYIISQSMLEAMSTGCCVVASSTQPVTEFIQDSYNGLLFEFDDFKQIMSKIEYSLDNKDKLNSIRQNARSTIIEKYSIEKVLPQQVNLITNLIKK